MAAFGGASQSQPSLLQLAKNAGTRQAEMAARSLF